MQSGSFVNLSRQRKEQAAARALQEQQAAAAAALALSNPPLSSLPPTLDIPFNSSSSSYYGSSPSYLSHSTGSGSSSNQSSAGASPLASPPPTQGSTPSYHLSPSSAATLGGHAYSPPSSLQDHTYHASANASSNFSLVRRHHTVGSRPQKYLSATQKERLDEEDGDEGASSRTGEGEDDYDDGGSTGAVEGVESSAGSSQSHGGLIVGAAGLGLARAGSLPSKPSGMFFHLPSFVGIVLITPATSPLRGLSLSGSFTPSQTSSISRSSTIKRRPSLGAARLDTIPAAGSLNPTSPSPDPKSPIEPSHEDAAEWDRALAQSRKHHSVRVLCQSSPSVQRSLTLTSPLLTLVFHRTSVTTLATRLRPTDCRRIDRSSSRPAATSTATRPLLLHQPRACTSAQTPTSAISATRTCILERPSSLAFGACRA